MTLLTFLLPRRLCRASVAVALLLVTMWITIGVARADVETATGDHVTVRWVAPSSFGSASPTTQVALYFEVDPEWHVYWRNPGDSGAEPRFVFDSRGAEFGPPLWPYPKRLPVAHLTNFGYEGNVAYLFDVTLTPGASAVQVTADLEWLVCKEECIPGFGQLSLSRPIGEGAEQWATADAEILAEFQRRIPSSGADSPWQVHGLQLDTSQNQLRLQLRHTDGATTPPEVFPADPFVAAQAPRVEQADGGITLIFNTERSLPQPDEFAFVVADQGRAWELSGLPLSAAAAILPDTVAQSLWVLLALAFAGGVILNLMPCVFPVLSIKLFSLMQASGPGMAAHRLREGLQYTAGVLVTFAALGAAFLALRAGGAAVGWGFQLQSPLVVLALALLFWLMGLSFLGVFEFGHRLMNLAGRAQGGGAFMTGVLAVFVAAPCTGPFMGAALGASATLPAVQAMAIFVGLGAGLAAPFLLLAASPKLAAHLPKPGAWMDTLRQALSFPLFATVLWLLWVLGHLTGSDGWLSGAILLLVISFALWLARVSGRWGRASAWGLALLATAYSLHHINTSEPLPTSQLAHEAAWQPFDSERISAARQQGQAVFIDFTAAWCITCQVNKKLVLDTQAVNALFEQHQVLRIRADWTRYDADITEALAALNRNSVPVYVYYPADGSERIVLPQLLTQDMIRDLFNP